LSKVFVLLLFQRLRTHLDPQLLEAQCGFRARRGTADQIFSLRRISELHLKARAPLMAAFVDLAKAFDSVNRDALWALLRARGVHHHLVALLAALYTGCGGRVVINGATSDFFPMRTGVRQGCPLSPLLFNVFMDFVMRQVSAACELEGVMGVRVGYQMDGQLTAPPGECADWATILALLYADDLVLLATSLEDLQRALTILERITREWGLQLNYSKTKAMMFGPDPPPTAPIILLGGEVDFVPHFRYLGGVISADGGMDQEHNRRITLARAAYQQMRPRVFDSPQVSLLTKLQFYRQAVLSILLYGAGESWAPSPAQLQQLDVFNTKCLRRIMRVWWTPEQGTLSNEELHAQTHVPPISTLIKMYRLRWIGHAARGNVDRIVRQLLFAHSIEGNYPTRARGIRMWMDAASADVAAFSQFTFRSSDWFPHVGDGKAWESAVSTYCIP
jgi:Reverse transcriptase (RNA-dependent DNA polymerase)